MLYIRMILSRISINVLSNVVFSDPGDKDEDDEDGVLLSNTDRLLIRDTGDVRAVLRSSEISHTISPFIKPFLSISTINGYCPL